MILRRIIAHFRKQEWTAIAIDFVIVVLGVGLIAYARQSQERVSALDTAKQTYYTAFGIYKCDAFIENLPDATQLGDDPASLKPGAFIESPGVVRWEPQVLSGERRAKLETIFELYGLKVTNNSIEFGKSSDWRMRPTKVGS